MDRVRFGRALGYGARHAAKALMQAADAATAPDSHPAKPERSSAVPAPQAVAARTKERSPRVPVAAARRTASKSFFHPVKRYSGTVLLQVVGTFFGVFALLMAQTTWKLRAGFHAHWNTAPAERLWLTMALFALFTWFAVSSFTRARRLERS